MIMIHECEIKYHAKMHKNKQFWKFKWIRIIRIKNVVRFSAQVCKTKKHPPHTRGCGASANSSQLSDQSSSYPLKFKFLFQKAWQCIKIIQLRSFHEKSFTIFFIFWKIYENVLRAISRGDEAEALLGVEKPKKQKMKKMIRICLIFMVFCDFPMYILQIFMIFWFIKNCNFWVWWSFIYSSKKNHIDVKKLKNNAKYHTFSQQFE